MLSCERASQLMSQSLDRKLLLGERFSLRFHLMMCRFCRRFGQQLALIRAVIRRFVSETEQNENIRLSEEARVRIAETIDS